MTTTAKSSAPPHIALGRPDPTKVNMLRIRDTLQLGRMWISEGLLPDAEANPKVTILGAPEAHRLRQGRAASASEMWHRRPACAGTT